MDLEEVKNRMPSNLKELKTGLIRLHARYGIDKVELGKIMIIASTTLLLVSIHAFTSLEAAHSQIKKVDDSMEQAEVVVNDPRLQDSLEAVEKINDGSYFKNSMTSLIKAVEQMDSSINKVKSAEKHLKKEAELFQWLALIGILGNVAGIAAIYI